MLVFNLYISEDRAIILPNDTLASLFHPKAGPEIMFCLDSWRRSMMHGLVPILQSCRWFRNFPIETLYRKNRLHSHSHLRHSKELQRQIHLQWKKWVISQSSASCSQHFVNICMTMIIFVFSKTLCLSSWAIIEFIFVDKFCYCSYPIYFLKTFQILLLRNCSLEK